MNNIDTSGDNKCICDNLQYGNERLCPVHNNIDTPGKGKENQKPATQSDSPSKELHSALDKLSDYLDRKNLAQSPTPDAKQATGEEGKYWYTDTEFPNKKVRLDGIREYIIDCGFSLSKEQIDLLLQGIGYWFLKRTQSTPAVQPSANGDVVEFAEWVVCRSGYLHTASTGWLHEDAKSYDEVITTQELFSIFLKSKTTDNV